MVPGAGPASGKGQVHRQDRRDAVCSEVMSSQSGFNLFSRLLRSRMASLYRAIRR